MNSKALIGHTGFVGSNLLRQSPFDVCFNSKNIQEMRGHHFSEVICAGVQAVKWKANKDPEADWAGISSLLDVLRTVKADRFVLISTIDVYPKSSGLDEDYDCGSTPNHAYGSHRFKLEKICQDLFPICTVTRLPALFGPGLKKNVIFDLLHDNCLDMINTRSSFQYYDLSRLFSDIQKQIAKEIPLLNLFTEPVPTAEILSRFFPEKSVGQNPAPEGHYDLRSRFGNTWGKPQFPYLYSREEVLQDMAAFIAREKGANA